MSKYILLLILSFFSFSFLNAEMVKKIEINGNSRISKETIKIYGNITSGAIGTDNATSGEHRIYQEALYPVKFGSRIYTNHRFRYEQRFVENQDLRTRYRYNLFLNIPLNKKTLEKKAIYLALYNEIFINGQREIGNNNSVEIFDRNRAYAAIGYFIKNGLRVQFGLMNQTTDSQGKNQLQVSLHHKF